MSISLENNIREQIYGFEPISLSEMDRVALMQRTDTKYVFGIVKLLDILKNVGEDYSVLEIEKERFLTYNTTYLDTPDYAFYLTHHNGKKTRKKIRYRHYKESRKTYLEYKHKNNKGITDKKRIQTDNKEHSESLEKEFLKNHVSENWSQLIPVADTNFHRITLVNKHLPERITIDLELEFKDKQHIRKRSLDGICIVEVKQSKFNKDSLFVSTLKKHRLLPMGFSKYCMAMAYLNPDVKKNLWKSKIRSIEKLAI